MPFLAPIATAAGAGLGIWKGAEALGSMDEPLYGAARDPGGQNWDEQHGGYDPRRYGVATGQTQQVPIYGTEDLIPGMPQYGKKPIGYREEYATGADQNIANQRNETAADVNRMWGRGAAQINPQQANAARAQQQQSHDLMLARAMGKAPSIAEMAGERQRQQAMGDIASRAGSARGAAGIALAGQSAQQDQAAASSNIAASTAEAAHRERLAAEQAAFGASSGIRGADEERAARNAALAGQWQQAQAQYELGRQGQGLQYEMGQQGMQQRGDLTQQQLMNEAAMQARREHGANERANAAAKGQFVKDVIGGASQVAGAAAMASDVQTKSPLAHKMYSPPEVKQPAYDPGLDTGPDIGAFAGRPKDMWGARGLQNPYDQGAWFPAAQQQPQVLAAPQVNEQFLKGRIESQLAEDRRSEERAAVEGRNMELSNRIEMRRTNKNLGLPSEPEAASSALQAETAGRPAPPGLASRMGAGLMGAGQQMQDNSAYDRIIKAGQPLPPGMRSDASAKEEAYRQGASDMGHAVRNFDREQNPYAAHESGGMDPNATSEQVPRSTDPAALTRSYMDQQTPHLSTPGVMLRQGIQGAMGGARAGAERISGQAQKKAPQTYDAAQRVGQKLTSDPKAKMYSPPEVKNPYTTLYSRLSDPTYQPQANPAGVVGLGTMDEIRRRSLEEQTPSEFPSLASAARGGSSMGGAPQQEQYQDVFKKPTFVETAEKKSKKKELSLEERARILTEQMMNQEQSMRAMPTAIQPEMMSDPRVKKGLSHFMTPHNQEMAQAMRSMQPYAYSYKPGMTPPDQAPGEANVGPMANLMESNKIAGQAIKREPDTGLRYIDRDKALKLTMGATASLQSQIDALKKQRARRAG